MEASDESVEAGGIKHHNIDLMYDISYLCIQSLIFQLSL